MATSPSPTSSSTETLAAAERCSPGTRVRDELCLSGDETSEALADILHTQFGADKLSAVIAGVWHNGEPVLFGALGESMPGVPATPDMHYMLGNLSTPMLTTAFLQQVEAGVISLDDKVSKWYPDLPDADIITVEMLLHDTTLTRDGNWPQPILQGYDGERGVWENVTGWSPSWAHFAGGIGSNADDVGTFLDALGSGELLSSEYHDIQWASTTVGLGTNKPDQYWAMGFLVVKDSMFLNPTIPGYSGGGGTLPEEGWTMVVYTTASQATDPAAATATDIFRAFTGIVSPEHSLEG
ncbi:MAG: CubicO group peptidase beta-lactamase class family [Subtercola sp.]|nr:CubicO group peptidase beta-lactamase class family [Subtercola sp.]